MLLVSGRFAVSQTIIPEAQEHFLTPSAHRDTHIFGGLGVTRIVTPTAPPRAMPTPTPLPSAWRSFEADAITGTNRSGLKTSGRMVGSDPYASLYSDPSLFLRCSGETFEVYANWGGRFLADNVQTDKIQTECKIDDRNPVSTFSGESVSNKTSFLESPSRFASNLLDGNQVVIRVTSYDNTTMTARFPITGLRHEKEKLGCW